MLRKIHKNGGAGGFTLVEIIIALAVVSIVMLGLMAIFQHLNWTWVTEDLKADMQQNARVAMDNMVRETMMMGYGSPGSEDRLEKVLVAEEEKLEFVVYTEDPLDKDHKYTYRVSYYFVDGEPGELRKKYEPYDKDPMNPASELDILLADNVRTLKFEYFTVDEGGSRELAYRDYTTFDSPGLTNDTYDPCNDPNGDSDLSDNLWNDPLYPQCEEYQAHRDAIRRVLITLEVETDKYIPGLKDSHGDPVKKTITLKADISPRNMWEGEAAVDISAPSMRDESHGYLIKVRDTNECGKLQAEWARYLDPDVAGYLVMYGISSDAMVNKIEVPADQINENGMAYSSLDDCDIQEYTMEDVEHRYYVKVAAYDHSFNLSTSLINFVPVDTPTEDVSPYPDILTFSGSIDDCTNNIPKPTAVENFAAATFDNVTSAEVNLTWDAPSDANIIGYRIYRNITTFDTFPIDESFMIAKETEEGDGWIYGRVDVPATEYTDRDNDLIGCVKYYYAICPVTCDVTRIYGYTDGIGDNTKRDGIYTVDQYATAFVEPTETNPPQEPILEAKAGWKRCFLSITWPTDRDYSHTELFVKPGSTNIEDTPELIPENLIPDHQSGYPTGTFKNFGTSGEQSIIYNSETTDLSDDAYPQLENNMSYTFVAVAYDLCGNPSDVTDYAVTFDTLCSDDPCGPPTWNIASPKIWVDASSTNRDTSTWYSNSQVYIGLAWDGIDKTDITTGLDFYGYYITKSFFVVNPDADPVVNTDVINSTNWVDYVSSGGLDEGQTYDYCVRATDCVWQNITEEDIITCNEVSYNYSQVKANNISDCLILDNIQPGKIRLYDDPLDADPKKEVAVTTGEYHNEVLFYIQNTSASPLTIDQMNVVWSNTNLLLKSVKFGDVTTPHGSDTELTYNVNASTNSYFNVGRTLNTVAASSGEYSGAIPVTLEFTNLDGSISEVADMRGQLIRLEVIFTNESMPSDSSGVNKVGGFTTGNVNGTDPLTFSVTGGPVINLVIQDQPVAAFHPFIIDNTNEISSLPAGYPEVGGKREVNMIANVTKPSTENIDGVWIFFAETSPLAVNPSGENFTSVEMLPVGNYYFGTIPAPTSDAGRGVWYYIMTETDKGNFARKPPLFDSYYYYNQLAFNKCNETPVPPADLSIDSSGFLTWSSVTEYDGGFSIADTDTLSYTVYRKGGFGGSGAFTAITTVGGTSFDDPAADGSTTYTYAVTAVNSCTLPGPNESGMSNEAYYCPFAGSDCVVSLSDSVVFSDESFSIVLASCSVANNGSPDSGGAYLINFGNYRYDVQVVSEINDTGVTNPITFKATTDSLEDVNSNDAIIYATDPSAGVMEAELVIYSGLPWGEFGCATSVVTVIVDPCSNTPNATTLNSAVLKTTGAPKGVTLNWEPVTTNADSYNSPAVYYTESVSYEVWYNTLNTADTLLGTFTEADLTTKADGSLERFITFNGSNNVTYNFWVLATDTCSPIPNKSDPSNIIFKTW